MAMSEFQPIGLRPNGIAWPKHRNPYARQPMRTCWWKGVDAYRRGLPMVPPYRNESAHGGTYGARANRVWTEGYETARNADKREEPNHAE